jgi:hypothetical protein
MLRQGDLASGDLQLTSADAPTTGRLYYGLRFQPTSSAATAIVSTMEQNQTELSGKLGCAGRAEVSRSPDGRPGDSASPFGEVG